MSEEFKKFPSGHEAITSCWRHYDPSGVIIRGLPDNNVFWTNFVDVYHLMLYTKYQDSMPSIVVPDKKMFYVSPISAYVIHVTTLVEPVGHRRIIWTYYLTFRLL